MKQIVTIYDSPFSKLAIDLAGTYIKKIRFLTAVETSLLEETKLSTEQSTMIKMVYKQLDNYFANPLTFAGFNLPLYPAKSLFQSEFREKLSKIPLGQTKTYGELAKDLQSHPRAIGAACRTNPFPIILPCHRVVGQKTLGGFSGQLEGPIWEQKKFLLQHEGYPF